jgi:hypothetical protein
MERGCLVGGVLLLERLAAVVFGERRGLLREGGLQAGGLEVRFGGDDGKSCCRCYERARRYVLVSWKVVLLLSALEERAGTIVS